MNSDELKEFLKKHNMDAAELADLLGLTRSAVDHWLKDLRAIAKPYGRLLRLFERHPELMRDFR